MLKLKLKCQKFLWKKMKILTNVCWSVLKRWGGSKLHSKVAAAPLQKFNQGSRETELEIRRARLFDHESSLSFSKLHKSSFWAPFELLLSFLSRAWTNISIWGLSIVKIDAFLAQALALFWAHQYFFSSFQARAQTCSTPKTKHFYRACLSLLSQSFRTS